jgi:hypothetical protein
MALRDCQILQERLGFGNPNQQSWKLLFMSDSVSSVKPPAAEEDRSP